LESKKEADNGREEKHRTLKIELEELLLPCKIHLLAASLNLEEGNDEGRSQGTEW
jgi:hypothetical protein